MDRNSLCRALGLVALSCVLLAWAGAAPAATITMQTVPVGNVGNLPDPTTGGLYGSVGYAYNIGTYDVTATQYTAFLNAVAQKDTYGLYNSSMAAAGYGQVITRTGSYGSYSYAVTTNGNFPVTCVTWGDAARFCNWLTNGQPTTGGEANGTTETGLYTLNGATTNTQLMAITRNTGVGYAIPTENEWYKAAYYDPSLNGGAGGYWAYPTKSNTAPDNSLALAATEANDANYEINGQYTDPVNYLTAVGTFAASPSAYGTFDQGGDVWQWDEASRNGSMRVIRGGCFNVDTYLQSDNRSDQYPEVSSYSIGFRVVEVAPEPTSLALLAFGVTGLLVRRKNTRR
jgi:formylglycine-generating enzyme required for sulfatase activity